MDKGVHTFSKGISLKVNVIVWLEFKLVFYDVTIQYIRSSALTNTSV